MFDIFSEIFNYCKDCKYYNGGTICNKYGYNMDIRNSELFLNEVLKNNCPTKAEFLTRQEIILLNQFLNSININQITDIETNKSSYVVFTINDKKFVISNYSKKEDKRKEYKLTTKNGNYKIVNFIEEDKELFKKIEKLFNDIINKHIELNTDTDIFDLI